MDITQLYLKFWEAWNGSYEFGGRGLSRKPTDLAEYFSTYVNNLTPKAHTRHQITDVLKEKLNLNEVEIWVFQNVATIISGDKIITFIPYLMLKVYSPKKAGQNTRKSKKAGALADWLDSGKGLILPDQQISRAELLQQLTQKQN